VSDACYICGGNDEEENLVHLCANCHQAVESLYDDRFFEELEDYFLTQQAYIVMAETRKLIKENVDLFVKECCRARDPESFVTNENLYEAYDQFCHLNGLPAVSPGIFERRISGEQHLEKSEEYIEGEPVPTWSGIELVDEIPMIIGQPAE